MPILTLRLSNDQVVILPTDLAHVAGLQERTNLQAIVRADGLELGPVQPVTDSYAANWSERRAKLRERAAALGLYGPDKHDEEYWQIVAPLMEELDHEIYA